MKLWQVLTEIRDNHRLRQRLSANTEGEDFENEIKNLIEQDQEYAPYTSSALKRHTNFRSVKDILADKTGGDRIIETNLLDDICTISPLIVYQPLGSQNYPDFWVMFQKVLVFNAFWCLIFVKEDFNIYFFSKDTTQLSFVDHKN